MVQGQGINPAKAPEYDLLLCRKDLNENYRRGTVGVKLAAIKRLYEAAVWRGLYGLVRLCHPNTWSMTLRVSATQFLTLSGSFCTVATA